MQRTTPPVVAQSTAALDAALAQAEERFVVMRAQQGDRAAFAQLVEQYDRKLLYFVGRMLGDADGALDVLQSVWLQVFRQLHRLAAPQAFRVWLYRLAHDQAATHLRRTARRAAPLDESVQELPEAAEEVDDERYENAELVHTALQTLSDNHRRVLTLYFLEEMSVEEIAAVVGASPGTVKSRLFYARRALRQRIEELLHG